MIYQLFTHDLLNINVILRLNSLAYSEIFNSINWNTLKKVNSLLAYVKLNKEDKPSTKVLYKLKVNFF